MVQPPWKTVWRFTKKLKIELPHDPALPLLRIPRAGGALTGQLLRGSFTDEDIRPREGKGPAQSYTAQSA